MVWGFGDVLAKWLALWLCLWCPRLAICQIPKPPPTSTSVSIVMLGCVGPFADGEHDKFDEADRCPEQGTVVQCGEVGSIKLDINNRSKPPIFLAAIGSSDKFQPGPAVRREYGSNDGLARARADWVIGQLGLDPSRETGGQTTVLSLIRGPSIHGEVSKIQSKCDRSVVVYGLWPTESSPAAASRK